MVDRIRTWDIPEGIVCADAGYGRVTKFRKALASRQLQYVVGIDNTAGAWLEAVNLSPPQYQGFGRPRKRSKNIPKPQSVAEIARALPENAWQIICWREGTKKKLTTIEMKNPKKYYGCLLNGPKRKVSRRNTGFRIYLQIRLEHFAMF